MENQKYPVEILTRTEIDNLLRQCSKRAPTGIRNRALIVVLWRCGLRISEALALLPKDIDPVKGTIRVLRGKGDKARTVGIDQQALDVLARWLEVRKARGINGKSPVFCTLTGDPVQPQYIRNLLRRLGSKAGIEKRVHAHGLRHTHASELRGEGVDMGVISKQLGHSSIATTARYLDHINPTSVVETMRGREW